MFRAIWEAVKVLFFGFVLGVLVILAGETFKSDIVSVFGLVFWFLGGYLAYRILRGSRAPKMRKEKGGESGEEEYDK